MNSIVYAIALIALAAGVVSLLSVWIARLRLQWEQDRARKAAQRAVQELARKRVTKDRDVTDPSEGIPDDALSEDANSIRQFGDLDRPIDGLLKKLPKPLRYPQADVSSLRSDFLRGGAEPTAPPDVQLSVQEIPLEVLASDPIVEQDVVAGLRYLAAIGGGEEEVPVNVSYTPVL